MTVSERFHEGRRDRAGALIAGSLRSLGLQPTLLSLYGSDHEQLVDVIEATKKECDVLVISDGIQRGLSEGHEEIPTGLSAAPPLLDSSGATLATSMKLHNRLTFFLPSSSPSLDYAIEQYLLPALASRSSKRCFASHVIRVFGKSRDEIGALLFDLGRGDRDLEVEIVEEGPEIVLSMTAKGATYDEATRRAQRLGVEVCSTLGRDVHGPLGQDLPTALSEALRSKRWTLAVVEVGTGGVVLERLAFDEARSHFFKLGLVFEDPRALGAASELFREPLLKDGSIDATTARAIARRIEALAVADFVLVLVGALGPHGGSTQVPVGLVHFAVNGCGAERSVEKRFNAIPRQFMGQWISATAFRLVLDHCRHLGGRASSAPFSP